MELTRVSLLFVVCSAPALLQADATIRYKTEMTSPVAALQAGAMPSSSVIYMKGSKGATVSGATTVVVDFVKQELTMIDTAGKKFATIPASKYADALAGMMPKVEGPAADMMKSMKTTCDSKKTGRVEAIQGVQAEERETNCSIAIPLPDGLPDEARAQMGGMGMKIVIHAWSAAAAERPRVPALWQLSGFELWQKYFMNPVEMFRTIMPTLAPMMDAVTQDQSATLRMSMEMSMSLPANMPSDIPGLPTGPLMKMTQEVAELSTAPVDDAVFQIPSDCTATAFSDVMQGIVKARTPAANKPSAQ